MYILRCIYEAIPLRVGLRSYGAVRLVMVPYVISFAGQTLHAV